MRQRLAVDGEFRFRHAVDVRFRDIDHVGHAHHSLALMYFEEGRAAYWREVVGRPDLDGIDYIMAEASIRWHGRVTWPATVTVEVRVSRVGRKHFEMEYRVCSAEGRRLISGRTVQVMYDYGRACTKPLPDDVRRAMADLDGPFGRDPASSHSPAGHSDGA